MINTLFSLYEKKSQGDKEAELLIELRNFFTSIVQRVDAFDPTTGISLSTSLDELLSAICIFNKPTLGDNTPSSTICTKDYLYKISDFCLDAFNNLYKQMKEESIRSHQVMPVYRVRELDSSDMIALSRRPGRNVKEKLSGRPFMQAVKRNMSCDILENRLLKEFAYRIRELLEIRNTAINDSDDTSCQELLFRADKFLHLEICEDIFDWNNAMPNNVLLQDKTYSKIWKAWKEINAIDDYIEYDSTHIDQFISLYIFWSILGKLSQYKNFHFVQQPVKLDYQNIRISPILDILGYCDIDAANIISWSFKLIENSFIITNSKNQRLTVSVSDGSIFVNQKEIGNGKISLDDLKKVYNFYADWIHKEEVSDKKDDLSKKNIIDSISFDIYSAKPHYAVNSKVYGQFKKNFIIQSWNIEGEKFLISLADSEACYVSNDKNKIRTTSIISLLESSQEEIENNIKDSSLISINLFKTINSNFKCDRIHLVVPDSISDFALQPIRKNASAVFPKVYTVPRSIGSVFKFQKSKEFQKAGLKNGDFVFVIDRTKNDYSITPVQAEFHQELADKNIPGGIRWIKHPTNIISIESSTKLFEFLNNQFNGCDDYWGSLNYENMLEDCRSFGIINEISEKNIFVQTEKILAQFLKLLQKQTISRTNISNTRGKCCVKANTKCYVIKASDLVFMDSDVFCNKTSFNPTEGSGILSEWQNEIPDILLWREQLPQLMMKVQLPKAIDLCFNQEVEPIYGKRIKLNDIKIPLIDGTYGEIFGLRAGQPQYQFPLVIGDSDSGTKYQAKLRSPAFPLDSDLDCKLNLYYTYGKDNPFELEFVPINNDSIPIMSVEWTLIDSKNKPIIYPDFPPKLTVDELIHFKKKEGDFTSLFSWAKKQLNSLFYFLENRCFATKIDKNENIFFDGKNYGLLTEENVISSLQIEKVFVHENEFEKNDYDQSELVKAKKCGTISFYLKDSEKGYKATTIVAGYSLSHQYLQKVPGLLFFPLLTIFGNKQIEDFQDEWKDFFTSTIENLAAYIHFYKDKVYSEQTFDILFSLLCCFGNDSWRHTEPFIKSFYENKNNFIEFRRHIAFALGTCAIQGQKVFFSKSIEYFTQGITENNSDNPFNTVIASSIYIISSIIWKNEDLIESITPSQILVFYNGLEIFLKYTLEHKNQIRNQQRQIINAALELLLAILRYRKFNNEEINKLMSSESKITNTILEHIEKIDKLIKRTNTNAENKNKEYKQLYGDDHRQYKPEKYWPKTRLNFGDLPQKGEKDSLCYVLEAYLKEEELTSQIVIKGFSESE